jgi:dipeptidyl aminopeptidase/acylaminoacyl peptidase
MVRALSITAALAALVAAVLLAGPATPAGTPLPKAGPAHTLARTPTRIGELFAEATRVAWTSASGVSVLDRATGRTRTTKVACRARNEIWTSTVVAGRALVGCDSVTSTELGRRLRALTPGGSARDVADYVYSKKTFDGYDLAFAYGEPVRAAGDGSTLVWFAFSGDGPPWHQDVWRLVGNQAKRVPYSAPFAADLAVSGRRFATLGWPQACGCDRFASYSPDGKEIVWSDGGAVWLAAPDGTKKRRVPGVRASAASAPAAAPRWAPSGAALAFDPDDAIYVVNADGSGERKVATGSLPAWSPDGKRLAFVEASDLWVVNADGTGLRRLTTDALTGTSRPDWSPDGTTLAAARAGDVWVVDVASGAERDLTPSATFDDRDPVWSPVPGGPIAFERRQALANGNTGSSVTVVDASGANVREVARHTNALHIELYPSWSRDGKRLAFVYDDRFDGLALILVVNADGTGLRSVSDQAHFGAPSWSPDGTHVVFGDDVAAPSQERGGIYTAATNVDVPATERIFPAGSTPLEVRDVRTGKLVRRWALERGRTTPGTLAFSGDYVTTAVDGTVAPFDVASGKALRPVKLPVAGSVSRLSGSGRWAVARVDGRIVLMDLPTGRVATLARVPPSGTAGPVIEDRRVVWAEPAGAGSRVREIVLR